MRFLLRTVLCIAFFLSQFCIPQLASAALQPIVRGVWPGVGAEGPMGVAVFGSYAYVACSKAGLQVIDVSDKSNPQKVTAVETGGFARNLAISGNVVFVACGDAGLVLVDITDPVHASRIDWADTTGGSTNYAWDVAIADNRAFVSRISGILQAYDISDPSNPKLLGTYDGPTRTVYGVAVSGTKAFLAVGVDGIEVIDISEPAAMSRVATWNMGAYSCYGVAILGQWLYVADNQKGLRILDISSQAPQAVGQFDTPGSSWGVNVIGNAAFVADQTDGLHILDVSDPTKPQLLASVPTGNWTYDVVVLGAFAYVADRGNGLTIVEIPPMISSIAVEGQSIRVNWLALGPVKLQRASSASSTEWQDVSDCEGKTTMTFPLGSGQEFFRLVR